MDREIGAPDVSLASYFFFMWKELACQTAGCRAEGTRVVRRPEFGWRVGGKVKEAREADMVQRMHQLAFFPFFP